MKKPDTLTEKSKQLSYLLRHRPQEAGLTLDSQGWCEITELLRAGFTEQELHEITAADAKGRYSIEGTKIRANQGHSTDTVKLVFKAAIPPIMLYHGTTVQAWRDIQKSRGLLPMNRHHVHLSADIETAQMVAGRRKRDTVILCVDTRALVLTGHKFFISENGVWLTAAVPLSSITEYHENI